MNENRRPVVVITIVFLLLAAAVAALMSIYWVSVLRPRLQTSLSLEKVLDRLAELGDRPAAGPIPVLIVERLGIGLGWLLDLCSNFSLEQLVRGYA